MRVDVFVNRKQRRQLANRGLFNRRLLRDCEAGNEDPYCQDREGTNVHEPFIAARGVKEQSRWLPIVTNSRNLSLWNSRRTRSFSALIRLRESWPSSWATPARSKSTAARKMDRQLPTWSRFIRSFGRTRTLSILESKRKSSKAISSSAG